MASEEIASFLYNHVCRFLVHYIIFEFLYLSGLSCVHFIPSKSVELKVHRSGSNSLHLVAAMGFKSTL